MSFFFAPVIRDLFGEDGSLKNRVLINRDEFQIDNRFGLRFLVSK